VNLSTLFKPAAPKADADAEAEYRRRLYAAHRAAGWGHGDALAHTNRDAAAGLWRGAFPGIGLGPVQAKKIQAQSKGQLTLFDHRE
jgi:hypothetical protein